MTGREEELAEVARWAEGIEQVLPDGSGALSLGGGYWTTCGDCSVQWSARTGGSWRSRRATQLPTGCSACCTTIGGMRTWFEMT